jgi:poly-gamma-glutamate synthesis protein (capsule biosynthesis protein)
MRRSSATTLALFVSLSLGTEASGRPMELRFDAACADGDRALLVFGGDVIGHRVLLRRAKDMGDGERFAELLDGLRPWFDRADLTYLNLEGPVAPGINVYGRDVSRLRKGHRRSWRARQVYSGFPKFNYPPYVMRGLAAAGVDVLSTANNHSLDRRALGIERTLEQAAEAKLATTGTRPRRARGEPFWTVADAGGLRVAFLACTWWTNGKPDPWDQVLSCRGREQRRVLRAVRELSDRVDIDAVVVTPHWGIEDDEKPRWAQRRFAKRLVEAGATLVVGNHPHVLQRWQRLRAQDGREGLVAYSLGNLLSDQRSVPHRTGALLVVELVRSSGHGARIAHARVLPTWVHRSRGLAHASPLDIRTAKKESRRTVRRLFHKKNLLTPTAEVDFDAECWSSRAPPRSAAAGGAQSGVSQR